MAPTIVSFTGTGNVDVVPTTGVTTASISVLTGDLVVIEGGGEDSGTVGAITLSFTGGITGTLTTHQSDNTANFAPAKIASAAVTADGSITGKAVGTGGISKGMNCGVWVIRNHGGVGNTAKQHATGVAPSVAVTCSANSALLCYLTDWTANNGARTYLQINSTSPTERAHFADGATYHFDAFDYADVGAAGSKTAGESAPTGQTVNLLAVEVLAAAAGGPTEPDYAAWLPAHFAGQG